MQNDIPLFCGICTVQYLNLERSQSQATILFLEKRNFCWHRTNDGELLVSVT